MKGRPGGGEGAKPGAMVTARHDVTHPHRVVITAETANHPRHAKKQTAHITANCEKKKKRGEVVVVVVVGVVGMGIRRRSEAI